MKLLVRLFIPILFLSFSSCDKIDEPFPETGLISDTGIIWDDSIESASNNGVRYVLIEDFTGHTCTNCPRAATEAERLRNIVFPDKVIVVAIHSTENFAAPKDLPGAPPGSYQSDHRTDESLLYENVDEFAVAKGLPRGLVSRRGESITDNKWKQECDKVFTNPGPTVANLHIKNFFDDSTKVFRVQISIEWLQAYAGNMSLQIQVIEDNIIDWQLDGNQHIADYVFKHMFRGSVNGAWGTPIPPAAEGTTTDTSFTLSIERFLGRGNTLETFTKPDFSDFSIVAFLYKKSPEYEVMQVNEAYLTNPK